MRAATVEATEISGDVSTSGNTQLGVFFEPGDSFCGAIPVNVTAQVYGSRANVSLPACGRAT